MVRKERPARVDLHDARGPMTRSSSWRLHRAGAGRTIQASWTITLTLRLDPAHPKCREAHQDRKAERRVKNRWPSGIPNLMVLALAKVATQQASFGSPMQCSLAPATTFASVYARIVSVMAVLGTSCFVQVQEFRGNRETSRVHTDHIAQGNAQRAREQSAEVAINSCSTGELSRHEHLSHVYVVVQHVHMHVACCCMLLLHHICACA